MPSQPPKAAAPPQPWEGGTYSCSVGGWPYQGWGYGVALGTMWYEHGHFVSADSFVSTQILCAEKLQGGSVGLEALILIFSALNDHFYGMPREQKFLCFKWLGKTGDTFQIWALSNLKAQKTKSQPYKPVLCPRTSSFCKRAVSKNTMLPDIWEWPPGSLKNSGVGCEVSSWKYPQQNVLSSSYLCNHCWTSLSLQNTRAILPSPPAGKILLFMVVYTITENSL